MKNITLSIVVPAYNEEKSIPIIVEQFAKVINPQMELVIVDNGSTDNTAKVLKRLLKNYPFARSVRVEKNKGYGYGILAGLKKAKGEWLAWTHADLQTDPKDVIKAFTKIQERGNKNILLKGRRRKRNPTDAFFTLGMSLFCSTILGTWMQDINAQPTLFHSSFFKSMKNPPYDFSLDLYTYYLAKKRNLHIIRLPVDFSKRRYGTSHWNINIGTKWKFIKRTITFSIKLRKEVKNEYAWDKLIYQQKIK